MYMYIHVPTANPGAGSEYLLDTGTTLDGMVHGCMVQSTLFAPDVLVLFFFFFGHRVDPSLIKGYEIYLSIYLMYLSVHVYLTGRMR